MAVTNRQAAARLMDFEGLVYWRPGATRPLEPMDVDVLLDFGGELFVLAEMKSDKTPIKKGQRLALENLARRVEMGGAKALAFLAWHPDGEGDVLVRDAVVQELFWQGRWKPLDKPVSVERAIGCFLANFGPEYWGEGTPSLNQEPEWAARKKTPAKADT